MSSEAELKREIAALRQQVSLLQGQCRALAQLSMLGCETLEVLSKTAAETSKRHRAVQEELAPYVTPP